MPVTINLRRTSNLRNILQGMESFSWGRFTCNIVGDSVRKIAYDIPERNFVNRAPDVCVWGQMSSHAAGHRTCSAAVHCRFSTTFARATRAAMSEQDVILPRSEVRPTAIYVHAYRMMCLQSFDAVGWAAGRASGL